MARAIVPVVRELLVTDIRCRADGCGAGPGAACNITEQFSSKPAVHECRYNEFKKLEAEGWKWQEPLQ